MRFLLLLLAMLPVAAVAQIETPGTGGGGGGGGGTSTPYYGPFTNTQIYGVNTNALRISSGVITSSLPGIDISQTWSNSGVTFSGLRVNVANSNSASASSLAEFQSSGNSVISFNVNGGVRFNGVTRISPASAMVLVGQDGGTYVAKWNNTAFYAIQKLCLGDLDDTYVLRDAAATVQLGVDAATATAQTIKAHDGSGSDKSAADMTIATGKSTGVGTGGNLKFKTSFPGASGSSLNGYQTRYAFSPNRFSLTDTVASTIFSVDNLTSGKIVGIEVFITTYARNGNDAIVNNDVAVISAFNDGAGIVTSVSASNVTNSLATLNSMTTEITAIDNAANGVAIQVKPTIGISGWSIYCIYQARVNTDTFVDVNSD